MTLYIVKMDVIWVYSLFLVGLSLAIVAQVIAYCNGDRTRWRLSGMWIGIVAVVIVAVAGQITSMKLRDYANSISARTAGGSL